MNHVHHDRSESNVMTQTHHWTVKCQDPADGSGDVIVDLPQELLADLGLGIGSVLTIEVINGTIVLKPTSSNAGTPSTSP